MLKAKKMSKVRNLRPVLPADVFGKYSFYARVNLDLFANAMPDIGCNFAYYILLSFNLSKL